MGTKGSATTRILKDGRVTVPEPVREQLSLSHGDIVHIDVKPIEEAK